MLKMQLAVELRMRVLLDYPLMRYIFQASQNDGVVFESLEEVILVIALILGLSKRKKNSCAAVVCSY